MYVYTISSYVNMVQQSFETVKLDASATELGNAFQISQIRLVKKYLCVLTCESSLYNL